MQQTLNFNANQIISKEELKAWDESLRELFGNYLRYSRPTGAVAGILDWIDESTGLLINDFFKVELGTVPSGEYDTIKIGAGRGLLHIENTTAEYVPGLNADTDALKNQLVSLLKWLEQDNIPVTDIETYEDGDEIYVGFLPIWNALEQGYCNISNSNQVTISNGNFNKLRGQSTKNPTKVRFYLETDEGAVTATNSETYEVVSIVSDTEIIISGSVAAESNVKILIVGSYDLASQGSITDKFCYTTANGIVTFTDDVTYLPTNGGFNIAKLVFGSEGVFSITDERESNLFLFPYSSDIVYRSLVQTITGQKTFTTSPVVFGVKTQELQDTDSFSTPLTISTYSITIPSTYTGRTIKIKASSAGVDDELRKIYFDPSYSKGDHFFLYIDQTSRDIRVLTATTAASIRPSNSLSATYITLKKGSIVELIADDAYCWVILNTTPVIEEEETWTQVTLITDSSSNVLDPSSNLVFYKRDRDTVVLHIKDIPNGSGATYVYFDLPYTLAYQVCEPIARFTTNVPNGRVIMNATGGRVFVYITDWTETINKQVRAQLV